MGQQRVRSKTCLLHLQTKADPGYHRQHGHIPSIPGIKYNRMMEEERTMTIDPVCTSLMRYRIFVRFVERYYRRKMRRPCFLMEQNSRWTVVTLEM